ncbi:alpha/beta hydrolase [Actinoallomurus spadix]|uniref:prolyl aminopeptidase n=1 Tax=Actinoallomurus spadix TaxID=79912 RepID=A0ABN0WZK0_9ACTN|nr:alpha/beta fold hydrolase [Actinoallomurus spadix]MCO5989088.1 alpha/beta hydrolase [Actinoallomurus spadix]
MRSRLLVTAVVATTVAAIGGPAAADGTPSPAARGTAHPAGAPAAPGRPRLADPHPCPDQPGFTCSTLRVPLDHRGKVPGTLDLQVATADNTGAPKGVLLFLTGGPGQPGVPYISRIATQRLPELAKDYRFVMLDQRGTGEFGAIDCPRLQAEVGSSDIAAPTSAAIEECAGVLGGRRGLYSTEQTVADYEALRRALGVDTMVVDGVSYGSFTAARYAVAHPARVRKVVLDSVLPHVDPQADDGLYFVGLHAQARVLRDACATAPACASDPAEDLAWVVRHRTAADGVKIFDTIVSYEFLDPTYRDPNPPGLPSGHGDLVGALHAARHGDPARLDTIIADLAPGGDPVTSYSSGLHIDAFCSDGVFPWGRSDAPLGSRQARLDRTLRRTDPRRVWPYTLATSAGNGFTQECLRWSSRPAAEPPARLPGVPVLLLNGDHDLSTPLEWAYEEAAHAPNGKVVVVKGASHSIQNREHGHAGRDAVIAFLAR